MAKVARRSYSKEINDTFPNYIGYGFIGGAIVGGSYGVLDVFDSHLSFMENVGWMFIAAPLGACFGAGYGILSGAAVYILRHCRTCLVGVGKLQHLFYVKEYMIDIYCIFSTGMIGTGTFIISVLDYQRKSTK